MCPFEKVTLYSLIFGWSQYSYAIYNSFTSYCWRVRQFFFVGLSDAPKYDIIWTDNDDVIDSFNPELSVKSVSNMYKACWTRVKHMLSTL